jgi:hypothetical protein
VNRVVLRQLALLTVVGIAVACGSGEGGGGEVLPISVSDDGRTLVTTAQEPFLILGDSAQALMVNLSVADAATYFSVRAAQGFNAAWVNLLCTNGGRPDATTFDGIAPFTSTLPTGAYDLTSPNEAYFQRVDDILDAAAGQGILIYLNPIPTRGFLATLRANGVTRARSYGRYLGRRYRAAGLIVWMSGADFQTWQIPADDEVVLAVAHGIRDTDSRHLQTTELNFSVSSSLDDPAWHGLLGINSVYTYYPTYARLYLDYARPNFLPNVFIEGNYEGAQKGGASRVTNAHDTRTQIYWTLLSGGAGAFYGNRGIWPFDPEWQAHLYDPGAAQISFARALFEPRRWYELVPDVSHVVATAGFGMETDSGNAQDNDYVTTARTPDGALVMSYFPVPHDLTIDMTKLSGTASASWFDPTTGLHSPDPASPVANVGFHVFTPPASPHADGASDWVLILEAE